MRERVLADCGHQVTAVSERQQPRPTPAASASRPGSARCPLTCSSEIVGPASTGRIASISGQRTSPFLAAAQPASRPLSARSGCGTRRRDPLEHRRDVPDRQRPGRPGSLPGTHLDGLAPPHHPRDARTGLPRRHRHHQPTGHPPDDRVDHARNPTPPGHDRLQPESHHQPDPALVPMAPTPPTPRPTMPLPAQIPTMIAKCHWSTRPVQYRPHAFMPSCSSAPAKKGQARNQQAV